MNDEDSPREVKSSTRSTRSSTPSSAVRATRTRVSRSSVQSTSLDSPNRSHDELSEKASTSATKSDENCGTGRQKRSSKGQNVKTSSDSVASASIDPSPSTSTATANKTNLTLDDNVSPPENGKDGNNVVTDRVDPVEKVTATEIEAKITSPDKDEQDEQEQQQQEQEQEQQLSQQNAGNNDSHDQGPSVGPTDVDTDDYESIVPIGEVNSQVGRKSTTGQICSLKTLIEDDVLQAGDNVLSMDCMVS